MYKFAFTLVAIAFIFAPMAQAQIAFCFVVDQNGYTVEGTMNTTTDVAVATGETAGVFAFSWDANAVRGTNNTTIRHHAFTYVNPDAGADPSCVGGGGGTDWFSYNGQIVGGNASSGYLWSGAYADSCGGGSSPGARTGVIILGSCPGPRPATDPSNTDGMTAAIERSAPQTGAAAQVKAAPEAFEVTAAPNPFAAGTVVQFDLPEAAHVRVLVYDTLGRQVAVLADEEREAGTHGVSFEGANLPAGVYLYRVEAGGQMASGQMTLVR